MDANGSRFPPSRQSSGIIAENSHLKTEQGRKGGRPHSAPSESGFHRQTLVTLPSEKRQTMQLDPSSLVSRAPVSEIVAGPFIASGIGFSASSSPSSHSLRDNYDSIFRRIPNSTSQSSRAQAGSSSHELMSSKSCGQMAFSSAQLGAGVGISRATSHPVNTCRPINGRDSEGRATERTVSTSESTILDDDDGSTKSLDVADASHILDNIQIGNDTSIQASVPRRNLTGAFEDIYVDDGKPTVIAHTPESKDTDPSATQNDKNSIISPTGVEDLDAELRSTRLEDANAKISTDETPRCKPSSKVKVEIIKKGHQTKISTTHQKQGRVSRSPSPDSKSNLKMPNFKMHPDLCRDLSQPLINRVSFYGILHDINKEANGMSSNDTCTSTRCSESDGDSGSTEPRDEEFSPIVMAVNGIPPHTKPERYHDSVSQGQALIDEEAWILSAIDERTEDEVLSRSIFLCPPSFAFAIGEKECADDDRSNGTNQYSSITNSVTSVSNSRTQLWKPGRSWWEAKSGKNPWIEPKSHNKRWRYLWPLIHYHKFLAKCVKKLKRNGVDVKASVSPVAAFLRDEVCAVSDHLAAVSKYGSEEWMSCLVHFNGWLTQDPREEKILQQLVSNLKLRGLDEPDDTQSLLLRSQIDEQFLRAMASAREQMAHKDIQREKKTKKKVASTDAQFARSQPAKNVPPLSNAMQHHSYHAPPPPGRPQMYPTTFHNSCEGPMMYPHPHSQYENRTHSSDQLPLADTKQAVRQNKNRRMSENVEKNWNAQRNHASASTTGFQGHSGMTHISYPQHYSHAPGSFGMYHEGYMDTYYLHGSSHQAPVSMHSHDEYYCYQNNSYPHPSNGSSMYIMPSVYPNAHSWPNQSEVNRPGPIHEPSTPLIHDGHGIRSGGEKSERPDVGHDQEEVEEVDEVNRSINQSSVSEHEAQTPHKYRQGAVPASPYWCHLDQATLAVTGLMSPMTPQRPPDSCPMLMGVPAMGQAGDDNHTEEFQPAPVMVNPAAQYYHYRSHGAVPPSPATQFMMSPQANARSAAYFGHSNHFASPLASRKLTNDLNQSLASVPDEETEEGSDDKMPEGQQQEVEVSISDVALPPEIHKMKALSEEVSD